MELMGGKVIRENGNLYLIRPENPPIETIFMYDVEEAMKKWESSGHDFESYPCDKSSRVRLRLY